MESKTKKRIGAVVGGIVLAGVAGIALAAYLSTGAGTATGTSTEAVSSTIAPDQAAAGLYPGATTTATVTVDNPNDYPVQVASISAGTSAATTGECPAGSVTTEAVTNPPGVIQPGETGTYTLTANMIANPENSCQGQAFTIPLTATLASAA